MNETEIKLIKKSWRLLAGVDPALIGNVFYTKLFNDTPSLRTMFPVNMQSQQVKLIEMLQYIVFHVHKPDSFVADVQAMAQRHNVYGAKPEHYKKVGEALLWTLEKGLGYDWNEPTAAAWAKCYKLLAARMLEE